MKRSFFTALLTAALIAAVTVTAAETPSADASTGRLEEAKAYYLESMIAGLNASLRASGQKELSPERSADLTKACVKWMDEDLIPFLVKNGILDEWIKMLFDEESRAISRKTADAKTSDELFKIAQEAVEFNRKHYPKYFAKLDTEEGKLVIQKLQVILIQTMIGGD